MIRKKKLAAMITTEDDVRRLRELNNLVLNSLFDLLILIIKYIKKNSMTRFKDHKTVK